MPSNISSLNNLTKLNLGKNNFLEIPDEIIACGSLECLHATAQAGDGRVHCAQYPPADIKMAGASGEAYRRGQVFGGMAIAAGTLFSALAIAFGWRWLIGRRRRAPAWLIGAAVLAPPLAFTAAILTRMFLWPLEFFSIG